MSDREFSDIEIFQHSGKGIPVFMTGHKNCLQADYFFGTGPSSYKKKNLPGRGLADVEKHCFRGFVIMRFNEGDSQRMTSEWEGAGKGGAWRRVYVLF
jgi:hypothetical protein